MVENLSAVISLGFHNTKIISGIGISRYLGISFPDNNTLKIDYFKCEEIIELTYKGVTLIEDLKVYGIDILYLPLPKE